MYEDLNRWVIQGMLEDLNKWGLEGMLEDLNRWVVKGMLEDLNRRVLKGMLEDLNRWVLKPERFQKKFTGSTNFGSYIELTCRFLSTINIILFLRDLNLKFNCSAI